LHLAVVGCLLLFDCCVPLRRLRSFPTRRSSDLPPRNLRADAPPPSARPPSEPQVPMPDPQLPSTRERAGAPRRGPDNSAPQAPGDRKSTRLNSSHLGSSYAVFCLKKKSSLTGFY